MKVWVPFKGGVYFWGWKKLFWQKRFEPSVIVVWPRELVRLIENCLENIFIIFMFVSWLIHPWNPFCVSMKDLDIGGLNNTLQAWDPLTFRGFFGLIFPLKRIFEPTVLLLKKAVRCHPFLAVVRCLFHNHLRLKRSSLLNVYLIISLKLAC